MNPLDLRGPEFLVLYGVVCVITLIVFYLHVTGRGLPVHARMPSAEARRHLRDPYLLAFLRGGSRELLRVVTFALCQRRLLSVSGTTLSVRSQASLAAIGNVVERAVLNACLSGSSMGEVLQSTVLHGMAVGYANPLRVVGLLRDEDEEDRRRVAFRVTAGVLLSVALARLFLALSRGRSNVALLLIFAGAAIFLSVLIYRRLRTPRGERALLDQQQLLQRLRGRVRRLAADGATDEAVLVAAAFGLSALPRGRFPMSVLLRRQEQRANSSSCSGSCGGSSGCGGGGGCGGCGS